jgi:hypothetical protein
MSSLDRLERLLDDYVCLGDRERAILGTIASRLLMGQVQYGPWSHGKKKNAKEAYEEALDLAVYTANGMLEQRLAEELDEAASRIAAPRHWYELYHGKVY